MAASAPRRGPVGLVQLLRSSARVDVRCLPSTTSPSLALGDLSNSCSNPFPCQLALPAPLAKPSPRTARRPTKRRRASSRVYLFPCSSAALDPRFDGVEVYHIHVLSSRFHKAWRRRCSRPRPPHQPHRRRGPISHCSRSSHRKSIILNPVQLKFP